MLDLVGALIDAGHAQVAVPAFDGHLAGVAHATVNLHDAVNDAIGHVGAIELGHTGLVAVIQPLVSFPGSMKGEPSGSLNFYRRVGNHPLYSLAISDGLTEGDTVFGEIHCHLPQALDCANAARVDDTAALASPVHAQRATLPPLSHDVAIWRAHVL